MSKKKRTRQPNKQHSGNKGKKITNDTPTSHHQLRIIGGEWRSRKLGFTAQEGLRPTQDRVRETLFNWLMYDTEGATCLDVFAGSGALGLEALSRGAKRVQFIEQTQIAANQLKDHLTTLKCSRGNVICNDARQFLASPAEETFDLIFLDPPFGKELLIPCCQQLVDQQYSQSGTLIYIEAEVSADLSSLPDQWLLEKDKSQSSKHIRLYRHQ